MNKSICANESCPCNDHRVCPFVAECPGYKKPNCTGCMNEYSCDWHPEVCNYTPDPREVEKS